MKLLSKIRFLPITIFFAAMMLTIKVSHIWDGIEELRTPTFEVAGAIAQTGAGSQEDPRPDEKPEADAQDAQQSDSDLDSNIEQSRLITNDPTLLSTAEIELLQHLSIRREEIDKREKEFDIRDGLMQAAESRIDKKVVELQNLQATIDSLIQKFDKQQDAKLLSLVKIYENMKPKDAANIFEDLEMQTLLEVAERMKERKLAPVMAKMNPAKAREMTVELRQLRKLPEIGG
jgi:flagellar motility protein MotE (MotC chaperone)